jgi:YggT family protein
MCQLNPILAFIHLVVGGVIGFLIICMVVYAVISWLTAFDIIRMTSPAARQITGFLDAITRPMVAPIRRFLPTLGGVDLSFLVAFLVLEGVNRFLLPGGLFALQKLMGGCG